MSATRKTMIIGAALAVVHHIEIGEINQDRAHGWYNADDLKWADFKHLQDSILHGLSPDMRRVNPRCKDAMAHLRQSMRIDYDEWFSVFPWLDTAEQTQA